MSLYEKFLLVISLYFHYRSFKYHYYRGGSSLRYYFEKVAMHHGLEYVVKEYEVAEGEFNRLLKCVYLRPSISYDIPRSWYT